MGRGGRQVHNFQVCDSKGEGDPLVCGTVGSHPIPETVIHSKEVVSICY